MSHFHVFNLAFFIFPVDAFTFIASTLNNKKKKSRNQERGKKKAIFYCSLPPLPAAYRRRLPLVDFYYYVNKKELARGIIVPNTRHRIILGRSFMPSAFYWLELSGIIKLKITYTVLSLHI